MALVQWCCCLAFFFAMSWPISELYAVHSKSQQPPNNNSVISGFVRWNQAKLLFHHFLHDDDMNLLFSITPLWED